MDTLRPISLRQDPSEPVDIGCGIMRPIRSSALAAVLEYAHDVAHAPSRVDAKPFEFDCLVITTHDHWEFRGRSGRSDVDGDSQMVGVAGDTYGCRHYHGCADANIVVALRAGAVEATTADAFDTLVFTLFDEASAASNARRPAGSPLRMQRAKRFIERHAFEKLTVADVAAEVGLSPFTVLRQFRAATGTTPYAYLLELRLKQAKRLLAKSHASVESVAQAVGFDDLAHFSRWFRIRTGQSASAFRRESGLAERQ